ncbi:unnamed protein product [Schistocephalus solidus]|uniref:GATOR2 complex protein WDR24 n=1 Tax=Schistocephalus solidus TaxID=70667 RepID=A0A183TDZ9_SCHSO|nr:unnamed protein product [Schistocephalus solidus]
MAESRSTRNHSPPTTCKNWCYDAESSLTCLAVSRKQPMVAIGGRNLIQILKIGEEGFVSVDKLATSSTGGDLRIWDISRGMTQTACFCGHSRTVHRIHFSPNAPNEVITASQDGTIKLFVGSSIFSLMNVLKSSLGT